MITCEPTILDQDGIDLKIQTVETTESYVLIRLRSETKIPSGHGDRTTLAAGRERFTLSDTHGMTLALEQSSSLGDGPFGGLLDLAFSADGGLDFGSPLTLRSDNAQVTFQL